MPFDQDKAPFELPKLPYADDALAPVISANTISFHHGKHHKAYVDNLNNLIKGTPYAELTLGEIIKKSAKDDKAKGIFNNSAQVWNHTFYWHSMNAKAGAPAGKIKQALQDSFGSVEEFQKAFKAAAVGQFGSGWAWLVAKDGKLAIETTSNADTPLAHGGKPLLVADVWEHAYYLDFQNRRPDHVQAWLEKLVNWSFAEENLG
ncbi:superoxide dismutase [Reyranella sp.]|uniref:superoxide dismutase n=1 Tax=Reyranella sp. TaxID=1929291 RepID=UPI003BAC05F9